MAITSTPEQVFAERLGIASPEGYTVLTNHPTQSATAIDGWKSALFGVPFLAVGAGMFAAAIAGRASQKHAPDWLIELFGTFFFGGGLFFFVHGVAGVWRKHTYQREAAQRPGEPWLYDHHWNRQGSAFSAFDDMLKRLASAVMWTAFLAPFAWIGTQKGAWPFLAGAIILGLFGLIFWYRWLTMLFDFLRYGNSFLEFQSFPFFLGERLNAGLRISRHVSELDQLSLTLRCVQEKYVTTRGADNRSTTQVVCYELYKDAVTLDRDRLQAMSEAGIPIEFRLPKDRASTSLAATPPIYWEIQAQGQARGANYEAFFLVPVYKSA
jgi:hypothetical protein